MTTIVADTRTGVMVSDSKLTIEYDSKDRRPNVQALVQKIKRCGPALVGAAGTAPWTEQVLRWAKGKRTRRIVFKPDVTGKKPDVEALVMVGGKIFHISEDGEPGEVKQPFFAIGSGAQAALGALKAGVDAVRAVEIACEIDPNSELPAQILRLEGGGEDPDYV